MKVQKGRKYETKHGFKVEIDSFDSHEGAINPLGPSRVLGRVFLPRTGQTSCSWDSNGISNHDGAPSSLDLVEVGEDDRDRVVTIGRAIAIEEITELLEYVGVDGIDPEVFEQFSEADLNSTSAKVVFGLLEKVYAQQ
jgi:hypothetical protein